MQLQIEGPFLFTGCNIFHPSLDKRSLLGSRVRIDDPSFVHDAGQKKK